MSREFTVIIKQDEEEYYVATVPQLHGCHTQARSLDELMARVKEAIELCLEVEAEQDLQVGILFSEQMERGYDA
jgi:predicted RNase H-like HicB family nuclease